MKKLELMGLSVCDAYKSFSISNAFGFVVLALSEQSSVLFCMQVKEWLACELSVVWSQS